jgi:hypothetical protein
MNVLFEIEGREAIPVRALAWMTQWHFSADMVVEALETRTYTKKERSFPWASKLRAYRNDGREIQEIEPRYWKNSVVPRIEELLEQRLPRETWEREATKAFPAGYFVWRDEWEPAYNDSPDGPDVLDESDDEDDKDDILDRSERTLNFSPAMPDDIEVLVREGFPQLAGIYATQSIAGSLNTGTGRRWTDDLKKEARAYKEMHGLNKTAEFYNVSKTTISKHTKQEKPNGFSAFSQSRK